jgi:hypothetical protein
MFDSATTVARTMLQRGAERLNSASSQSQTFQEAVISLKKYMPGAEKDRVPAKWMPWLVASSIANGFFNCIAAFSMLSDKTTGCLLAFITWTSINYWSNPKPGIRHLLDVIAIYDMALSYGVDPVLHIVCRGLYVGSLASYGSVSHGLQHTATKA